MRFFIAIMILAVVFIIAVTGPSEAKGGNHGHKKKVLAVNSV